MAFSNNWNTPINIKKELKINGNLLPIDCADYKVANKLVYSEEPTRSSDYSLNNKEIDTAYIPNITITFSFLPIRLYQELLPMVNTTDFELEFYDYTTNTIAIRNCYMTEESINKLHSLGTETMGVIALSLTCVSRYGYLTYDDLKSNTIIGTLGE